MRRKKAYFFLKRKYFSCAEGWDELGLINAAIWTKICAQKIVKDQPSQSASKSFLNYKYLLKTPIDFWLFFSNFQKRRWFSQLIALKQILDQYAQFFYFPSNHPDENTLRFFFAFHFFTSLYSIYSVHSTQNMNKWMEFKGVTRLHRFCKYIVWKEWEEKRFELVTMVNLTNEFWSGDEGNIGLVFPNGVW